METDNHILLILKVPCTYTAINYSSTEEHAVFFFLCLLLCFRAVFRSVRQVSSKRSPLVREQVLASVLWYSLAVELPGSILDMRLLIEECCVLCSSYSI